MNSICSKLLQNVVSKCLFQKREITQNFLPFAEWQILQQKIKFRNTSQN